MNSSISYTEHLHDLDQIKEEIDNDSPFNFHYHQLIKFQNLQMHFIRTWYFNSS